MLKKMISFVMFLVVAQTNAQNFSISIYGGPSIMHNWGKENPELETLEKNEHAVSFTSGMLFSHKIYKGLRVQYGLSYDITGYKNTVFTFYDINGNEVNNLEVLSKNEYITLPLSFSYSFGKKFKTEITAGAFFSVLAYASDTYIDFDGTRTDYNTVYERKDMYKSYNTGALLAVSETYYFNNGLFIGLNIRDKLGCIDILSSNPGIVTNYTNNIDIFLSLGFSFPNKNSETK